MKHGPPEIPLDDLAKLSSNDARWLFVTVRQAARDQLRRQEFADEWLSVQARAWTAPPEAVAELKTKGFLEPGALAGCWKIADRYWRPPPMDAAERKRLERQRRAQGVPAPAPRHEMSRNFVTADQAVDNSLVQLRHDTSRDSVTDRDGAADYAAASTESDVGDRLSRHVTEIRDSPQTPQGMHVGTQASSSQELAGNHLPAHVRGGRQDGSVDPIVQRRVQVLVDFGRDHLGKRHGPNGRERSLLIRMAEYEVPIEWVTPRLADSLKRWRANPENRGRGDAPPWAYFEPVLQTAESEWMKKRPAAVPELGSLVRSL